MSDKIKWGSAAELAMHAAFYSGIEPGDSDEKIAAIIADYLTSRYKQPPYKLDNAAGRSINTKDRAKARQWAIDELLLGHTVYLYKSSRYAAGWASIATSRARARKVEDDGGADE